MISGSSSVILKKTAVWGRSPCERGAAVNRIKRSSRKKLECGQTGVRTKEKKMKLLDLLKGEEYEAVEDF